MVQICNEVLREVVGNNLFGLLLLHPLINERDVLVII